MNTTEKELKNFNFPEILIDLHKNRKTGTLTVYTGEVVKKVYLEKGKAVFASSTDEDDRLGETLIKLGKITIDQYDRSVELLKETGKRQGTILVELGYLTPKDLVLGVKSQVREIIYSLFGVEYAEYEFDEGELPKREVITLQMSMGDLVYEGMKRIDNVVRIKRDMPEMNAVLRLREDTEHILQDIALSHKDQAMLSLIDGKKTVKELVDTAPNGTFEAMKILYVLCITGIIEEKQNIESVEEIIDQDESILSAKAEENRFEERVNDLFLNLYKYAAHDLLGIDESSDTKTVQSNYYRLVKEFHPDQSISASDPIILDKLIAISDEIQNAYVLLREDNKRKEYFEALGKNLREEERKTLEEEHFESELSRLNEEFLSSREESDERALEGDKEGELLNGIPTNPPYAFSGDTYEEQYEGYTPKIEEEELVTSDSEEKLAIGPEGVVESDLDAKTEESSAYLDYMVEENVEIASDVEGDAKPFSHDGSAGEEIDNLQDEPEVHEQSSGTNTVTMEPEKAKPDFVVQDQNSATEEEFGKAEGQERRRHQRFTVDGCEVSGEMFFVKEVSIIDISLSGIALRIDRQLRVGGEYFLNLHHKEKVVHVKGEVVRSSLISSKTEPTGDIIPEYMVGIEYVNLSQDMTNEISDFINSYKIDDNRTVSSCALSGTRLHGRFQLELPAENILDLMSCYQVKVLSLSGMLIESDQAANVDERIWMNISISEKNTVSLLGRIVSCRSICFDPERYELAIEFIEIPEEDTEKLTKFLAGVSDSQKTEIPAYRNEAMHETITQEFHEKVNESCSLPLQEMESDSETPHESFSPVAINRELYGLIAEIKSLLTQLRTEIPSAVANTISTVEKPADRQEPEKPLSDLSYELLKIQDDIPDHGLEVSREEYGAIPEEVKGYLHEPKQEAVQEEIKTEPQKALPAKKKLKLWHIVIPVLFLLAATASFLFIYTPQKQKAVSQPVQAKKEMLPAVNPAQTKEANLPVSQKTPETPPVSTPEGKKASTAAASQGVQHTIELIALESTWLSATIDEKASKEMIMKAGDKVKWTAKNNVSLIIGNAAGLKVVFDGKEIAPLGGKGKVVRLKLPSSRNS